MATATIATATVNRLPRKLMMADGSASLFGISSSVLPQSLERGLEFRVELRRCAYQEPVRVKLDRVGLTPGFAAAGGFLQQSRGGIENRLVIRRLGGERARVLFRVASWFQTADLGALELRDLLQDVRHIVDSEYRLPDPLAFGWPLLVIGKDNVSPPREGLLHDTPSLRP